MPARGTMLFSCYCPSFSQGVKEVHIVYDIPVSSLLTPKAFEQGRRDTEHSVSSDHEHVTLQMSLKNGVSICTVVFVSSGWLYI